MDVTFEGRPEHVKYGEIPKGKVFASVSEQGAFYMKGRVEDVLLTGALAGDVFEPLWSPGARFLVVDAHLVVSSPVLGGE